MNKHFILCVGCITISLLLFLLLKKCFIRDIVFEQTENGMHKNVIALVSPIVNRICYLRDEKNQYITKTITELFIKSKDGWIMYFENTDYQLKQDGGGAYYIQIPSTTRMKVDSSIILSFYSQNNNIQENFAAKKEKISTDIPNEKPIFTFPNITKTIELLGVIGEEKLKDKQIIIMELLKQIQQKTRNNTYCNKLDAIYKYIVEIIEQLEHFLTCDFMKDKLQLKIHELDIVFDEIRKYTEKYLEKVLNNEINNIDINLKLIDIIKEELKNER